MVIFPPLQLSSASFPFLHILACRSGQLCGMRRLSWLVDSTLTKPVSRMGLCRPCGPVSPGECLGLCARGSRLGVFVFASDSFFKLWAHFILVMMIICLHFRTWSGEFLRLYTNTHVKYILPHTHRHTTHTNTHCHVHIAGVQTHALADTQVYAHTHMPVRQPLTVYLRGNKYEFLFLLQARFCIKKQILFAC